MGAEPVVEAARLRTWELLTGRILTFSASIWDARVALS